MRLTCPPSWAPIPSAAPVAVVAALVLAPALAAAAPHQRTPKHATHDVLVRVVDGGGAPILDLQPSEIEVTEQGVKRQVVGATLVGKMALRVLLFVDTSNQTATALMPLRQGVLAFLEALPARHEAALIATGRRASVRVAPTIDREALTKAANRLATDGPGTSLVNALLESDDRFVANAGDHMPVLVIVTSDGPENSSGVDDRQVNAWLQSIRARGLGVHAITLKFNGTGAGETVAEVATHNAGGRYDFIDSANGLAARMRALAEQIAGDFDAASTKYRVAFVSDAADWTHVEVGVSRAGARVETSAR